MTQTNAQAGEPAVLVEKRGQAMWVTINLPDKRNAINNDVVAGIRDGWRRAHADGDVRVIVLTAAGEKAFCAGGDLQPGAGFAFDLSQPNIAYADMLREVQNATLPSIARVNGVCMAGGVGLLCMTDMAIAADHAQFGLPEVKIGLFPMQVLSLLQTMVPRRTLREWCLTGEPFGAAEAKDAGLLNHVVPAEQLDAKTQWLVDRLAGKSPTALRRGKYAMRAMASMSFDESIAYTESQIALLAMTEDAREGLASFNEKKETGMDRTLNTGAPTQRGAHAVGLAEWLTRRAARAPHRPALTCDDVHWTYGELVDRVERMSAVLTAGGVVAGERVGYLGLNDPMFIVVLFATARLGGICVPLNFRLSGAELAFVLDDAGVHTLVVGEEHIGVIDAVRDGLKCSRYIHRGTGAPGWESADVLMAEASAVPASVPVRAGDVAVIMYTSGTTGHPKGAMLTHGNFWTSNLNEMFMMDMTSADVTLNFAPMFHVGGLLCGSMTTLLAGAHLVLQRSFEPKAVLDGIAKHRVTVSFAVPSMLLLISQHCAFETSDLSSLRLMTVGGAPMPEPLLRLYGSRGIPVHQGYGLTETAAMVTFLHPDRSIDKLGSSGTPPLLTEIKLIDAAGDEVTGAGATGEICVRGGNVMPGYWHRPEANVAAFTADGWFRSGDIGYRDAEGFLFVCDRLKDMVISGGENIYPAEVENVLYDHPDVAEAAVIGAPDAQWGERVVAVIAPKPGKTLTLEDLREYAQTRLARYKLPKELRLVEALPRNPAGKVEKARLREQDAATRKD